MRLTIPGIVRVTDIEEEHALRMQRPLHLIEYLHQGLDVAFDGLFVPNLAIVAIVADPIVGRRRHRDIEDLIRQLAKHGGAVAKHYAGNDFVGGDPARSAER